MLVVAVSVVVVAVSVVDSIVGIASAELVGDSVDVVVSLSQCLLLFRGQLSRKGLFQ